MATVKNEKSSEEKVNSRGEKLVKIKIPKTRNESGDVFVSLNERTWNIQRGVEVEVPECVAILLQESEDQRDKNIENLPD